MLASILCPIVGLHDRIALLEGEEKPATSLEPADERDLCMPRTLKTVSPKRCVTLTLYLGLTFGAVIGPASLVLAQEPGEPVELALPAPMRSLKTVPTTQELLFILRNPGTLPVPRRESTVALPDLAVHALNLNPLTALELTLVDIGTADQEISHDISFSPN